MKALSLLQPWASLIAIGAKQWETRSWQTSYRGRVAIHASKRFSSDLFFISTQEPFLNALSEAGVATPIGIPLGKIIAVAEITNIVQTSDWKTHYRSYPEEEFGNYAPGRFAWKLENVRALKEPVPCKGSLSIWTVPDDVAAEVERRLA